MMTPELIRDIREADTGLADRRCYRCATCLCSCGGVNPELTQRGRPDGRRRRFR